MKRRRGIAKEVVVTTNADPMIMVVTS